MHHFEKFSIVKEVAHDERVSLYVDAALTFVGSSLSCHCNMINDEMERKETREVDEILNEMLQCGFSSSDSASASSSSTATK